MLDYRFSILVIFLVMSALVPSAQRARPLGAAEIYAVSIPAPTPGPVHPPYSSYKNVSIGMTADEARSKLGAPTETSDEQDYFKFSENETSQVYYDAAHKVTAITVTYTGKLDLAPTPRAIFGADAEVKPDGGIFKMVKYPKAGFWISYNKTGGDDPLIIIAIQKM